MTSPQWWPTNTKHINTLRTNGTNSYHCTPHDYIMVSENCAYELNIHASILRFICRAEFRITSQSQIKLSTKECDYLYGAQQQYLSVGTFSCTRPPLLLSIASEQRRLASRDRCGPHFLTLLQMFGLSTRNMPRFLCSWNRILYIILMKFRFRHRNLSGMWVLLSEPGVTGNNLLIHIRNNFCQPRKTWAVKFWFYDCELYNLNM